MGGLSEDLSGLLDPLAGMPLQLELPGLRCLSTVAPITCTTVELSQVSLKMRVLIEDAKVLAAVALRVLSRLPWWPSLRRRRPQASFPRTRRR